MRPLVWVETTAYGECSRQLETWADLCMSDESDELNWRTELQAAEAAVVLARRRFDRRLFDVAPRLKVVARLGAGYDNIDLEAATAAGVCVTNTPGASTQAVAEHTVALLLAWMRRISQADRMVRTGRWSERRGLAGPEAAHLTLGIVGIGRIGCRVAQIAQQGFGMRTLAYDPNLSDSEVCHRFADPAGTLEELLGQSDIVSLHAPASPHTKHMMNARTLALMKPGSLLINTARGSLVDLDDLADALPTGRPAGAALDVYEHEPVDSQHRLFELPGVICSPHSAGLSNQAIERVGLVAAEQVFQVLHGQMPEHLVNRQVWSQRKRSQQDGI